MSVDQTAKLLRSASYFPVADVGKSLEFYEQKLGFECEYSAGTPAQFAICSRDGRTVMFRRVAEPELITPNEMQGGTWDAFFWVDDAGALHAEFAKKAVTIVYGPLIQELYNMKEFAVRDCDGHVLGFGQSLN